MRRPYEVVVVPRAACTTISSHSAHRRHLDELPGRGHRAHRHFDQRGHIAPLECAVERKPQLLRTARALGLGAEALGVFHKVRVGEIAGDQPVAVLLLLDAPHIAESAVVEHDGRERNAMAHRGGKLVRSKEKAAIPRDGKDGHVAARVLGAERSRKAPAQIVLITG